MVFSLVPINYSYEDYKIDRRHSYEDYKIDLRPPKRRRPRIRR
jgi:hypothetical protein